MIDYEILKVIWWLFIGVLLVGFASWTATTWASARSCRSSARTTTSAA